jgi:xanthine dehydrogenase large subunit
MLGISALLALSDAVASVGGAYPALDTPATPERLLFAVERLKVEPVQ